MTYKPAITITNLEVEGDPDDAAASFNVPIEELPDDMLTLLLRDIADEIDRRRLEHDRVGIR